MTAAGSPFGVYVHIPFCRMLCTYCDFVKYRGMEAWHDRYVDALLREAATWADQVHSQPGCSLFFGGGTPSVLGGAQLARLRAHLAARFALDKRVDYCLEANPEDIDAAFATGIVAAGFNRLSVGVQTFDDALLRRLGRLHTGAQAEAAIRLLQDAGVDSVSADLIFGLPGQTLSAWRETLERALDLGVPHLSCYALTVEPATPLGRQIGKHRITIPDDDAAADMYDHARARLAAAGYRHYEVSNWSRPGHESRHNRLYWHGDDYVGLGAGAVGCLAGRRWWNQRQVERYCVAVEQDRSAVAEEERLTPVQRAEELLLLGLRTDSGVDLERFRAIAGASLAVVAGAALTEALADGLVLVDAGRLRAPEARWGVLHSIVARLLAGMVFRTADGAAPALAPGHAESTPVAQATSG